MAGPLEGLRVVEFGVWVAGPAAVGILADWGADVVEIEPPDGDPARTFGRGLGISPQDRHHISPPFEMDNRGNTQRRARSRVRGRPRPRTAHGRRRLPDHIRTGALRRIGLHFEAVAAANPVWSTAWSPATAPTGLMPTGLPTTWPRSGPVRAWRTC